MAAFITKIAKPFAQRGIVLLALLICWLWAWASISQHIAGLWWHNEIFQYGLLVPLVSLWLITQRFDDIRHMVPQLSWRGAIVFGAAAMLNIVSMLLDASIIGHIGLLLGISAAVWMMLGDHIARMIKFPLFFLLMAVPFGVELIPNLQVFTARITLLLLDITGVNYSAEGVIITLSSGIYRVARACAGVQFFMASVVLSVLLAHLTFSTWRGRILMVVSGLVIPICANALRVASILLIGELTDSNFAEGVDHIVYGWVFLSVVLVLVIATAYSLGGGPKFEPESGASYEHGPRSLRAPLFNMLAVICAVVFGLGLGLVVVEPKPTGQNCTKITAPNQLAETEFREIDSSRILAAGAQFESYLAADRRAYRGDGHVILADTYLFAQPKAAAKLLSAGNKLAGQGWYRLRGAERIFTDPAGNRWQESHWRRGGQYQLVFYRYASYRGYQVSPLALKLDMALVRTTTNEAAVAAQVLSVFPGADRTSARKIVFNFIARGHLATVSWRSVANAVEGMSKCAE